MTVRPRIDLPIIKLKPTTAKGTYVKSIYLSSTMSAGIKVDPKTVGA